MKNLCIALMLLVLCLTLPTAFAEDTYGVLYPSEAESAIVDGRDFYIVAKVSEDSDSAVVRLLNDKGEAVRMITGGTQPQFYLEYAELNAFNTEQAEYFMPDLIYHPDQPDSLYDGSIKCYIKNGMLFAVVAGGYYRMDGRDIVDNEGKPYTRLTAGEYTIEIEAGDMRLSSKLTLGATEEKVMSRFSPNNHMTNVSAEAKEDGWRTYTDPLPGYWSPSSFIPGQEDDPYFAEVKDRWQLADAMEYESGTVHLFIYNISASSATNAVELAALQLDNAVDTRMKPYHYDIGEPLLAYTDVYLMGKFTPFAKGDKLALMRAELTETAEDNFYLAYSTEERPIDLDVYDGVGAPVGQALTFFGVVCPIQNDVADMTKLTESAWEIGNRVTQIEYAFTCDGKTWTERRDVGLTRMLDVDWEGYSLFEFAHSFTFEEALAGKTVAVSLQGYDAHDKPVEGTEESIAIEITAN